MIVPNNKDKLLGGGVSTQTKTLFFDDELNQFIVHVAMLLHTTLQIQ